MTITPDTPVTDFPGVGPARAKKLEKLGILRAADLLTYYPRDYEDRRRIWSIRAAPLGEKVCVSALAAERPVLSYIRKGMELVKLRVVDNSGTLYLTFFNQSYLKNSFQPGEEYVFYGEIQEQGSRRSMVNPVFEREGDRDFTGRIVPVYPLTAGISNHLMVSLIRQAVEQCAGQGAESLPASLRAAHRLVPAERACLETKKHFGNTVYLFTPLYIANYCENYCVYCGFNCYNHIHRMKLSMEQIEHEMEIIAQSGMEEILLLTGESRSMSSVEYIGEACKLARKYFRMVGLEIYPVNTDEYRYLHECGADYVTVFQETYDRDKYETLHLMGHKRVWPYRFDAQERALRGGMRGVAFSALLGLADFRKDALASALHVYYLQRKYPAAEMSLSCPRLRPIINNDKINPLDVGERQLCQVLCAYRIFLPFVGITVSSREDAAFRNGIVRIAATKVSAGVSTGIGDHESKYQGKEAEDAGDEQFEISDSRSLSQMYQDMAAEGLQPVLNDYLYV